MTNHYTLSILTLFYLTSFYKPVRHLIDMYIILSQSKFPVHWWMDKLRKKNMIPGKQFLHSLRPIPLMGLPLAYFAHCTPSKPPADEGIGYWYEVMSKSIDHSTALF